MITNKKFRNKTTGEIVTQFVLTDIANFEEVEEEVIKNKLFLNLKKFIWK
jgi:hypothetical protein|tara:strand:+ start:738 stop:887 length:150 start_codon:yes stop_codon:yes gene_type:complete